MYPMSNIKCKQTSERLNSLGPGKCDYIVADLKDKAGCQKLCEDLKAKTDRLTVLINNSGATWGAPWDDFPESGWDKLMALNVKSIFYVTVGCHELLKKGATALKPSTVINIASMAGKIATPKSTVYSATKFAVLGFSNALRLELKPLGISVMTVNPGPIRTEFFDKADKTHNYLNSLGNIVLDPEEVAYKIVSKIGTSRREVNLPYYMEVAHHLYEVFPHMADYLTGGIFNKK